MSSVSRSLQAPETFNQALATGWVGASDVTTISAGRKKRTGVIFLRLKGRPQRLSFPYKATKAGFEFGAPMMY